MKKHIDTAEHCPGCNGTLAVVQVLGFFENDPETGYCWSCTYAKTLDDRVFPKGFIVYVSKNSDAESEQIQQVIEQTASSLHHAVSQLAGFDQDVTIASPARARAPA
jgi:hypothetical protein